jgi:starch-binding outer membrane protein, SusD/RagB family
MNSLRNINPRKWVALLFVFALLSCSDFLEIDPQQSLKSNSALLTLSDVRLAVNGMYDLMTASEYYGRYFPLLPDVMSDDAKQNATANRAKEMAQFSALPSHFILVDMWNWIYSNINRANMIISTDLTVKPADQATYNYYKGQAYAIRALGHFDLVRMFAQTYSFTADASHAGIPIKISPSLSTNDFSNAVTRSTVAEVYTQVINDLLQAETLLLSKPTAATTTAALYKEFAQGLLSRVYLYKGDYANAAAYATKVIDARYPNGASTHTLVNNAGYRGMFTANFSTESLLELAQLADDTRGSETLGRMYIAEGYGDYLPSLDLYNLIAANDARRANFKLDPGLAGIYAANRVDKYNLTTNLNNTKVMRLSEVYLNRAEALAKLGTNNTQAQSDLNAIRRRAIPTAPLVTATGQALIDEILLERRKELCFEGHRLWDLTRNGKGVVRVNCTAPADKCNLTYPNNLFILPIPDDEINRSGIAQNPGYF